MVCAGVRIRINGIELRYGRTFVSRVCATRRMIGTGANTRFSTLVCVRVRTATAISFVNHHEFAKKALNFAGGDRMMYAKFLDIASRRHSGVWTNTNAAIAGAEIALIRQLAVVDGGDLTSTSAANVVPWTTDIGDLSTAYTATALLE